MRLDQGCETGLRLLDPVELTGGRLPEFGSPFPEGPGPFGNDLHLVASGEEDAFGRLDGIVHAIAFAPRPALDEYLVDRYREYVSGLLDVTVVIPVCNEEQNLPELHRQLDAALEHAERIISAHPQNRLGYDLKARIEASRQ